MSNIKLLQDLDRLQSKSKKGKNKSEHKPQSAPPLPSNILNEEFQKKIIENAQLLSQLSDRSSEIDGLNQRIQQLEYKLDISERTRIELENKCKETIDKLEKERNKYVKEETVSWSSSDGKKDGLDLLSYSNNKLEPSPFSSPSVSRRSSKSTVEMGPPRKTWASEDFEFTKYCDLEKELNYWKTQFNIYKLKYDEVKHKESTEKKILESNNLEPVEIHNMV